MYNFKNKNLYSDDILNPSKNNNYYYDFGTGKKVEREEVKKERDAFLEGFNGANATGVKEENNPFIFDEPEYTLFPLASFEKDKVQNFPSYSTAKPTPVNYAEEKPKNTWYSYLGGDLVSDEDLNLFIDSFARENAILGNQNILYSKKEKPNFVPNPNKRKGSENRQPSGIRERNVRHPDGEEHSRVPKGSGGRPNNIRRSEIDEEMLSKILGGAAAAGTGYLIYRGARMLPSLLPPFWATIPANIIAP